MTFFLAGQLDKPVTSRVDASLHNAQIEALTVHMRQLFEFFWGERADRRPLAADYFPDDQWERIRPPQPGEVVSALVRLSYEGTWSPPADRVWDLVTQAHGLVPAVVRFAETVDPSLLATGYTNGLRVCAQLFSAGTVGEAAA